MILKNIENTYNGNFLHGYNLTYENTDNKEKVYEIVTRTKISDTKDLSDNKAEGVSMILFDETKEHMLLLKEYRMAVNKIVINTTSGLIDPGETIVEAAKRELKEETGLELVSYELLPPSYSAVGVTNEKIVLLIGTAKGNFTPSTSANEEIDAKWYTREEVKALFEKYTFSARTQVFAYMFMNGII